MQDMAQVAGRLRKDVTVLGGDIGERNIWRLKELRAAAEHILGRFAEMGFPCGRQEYAAEGVPVFNFDTEVRGKSRPEEIIVVGAHYDTRCGMKTQRGTERAPGQPGTPGANDNGSGIAGVLEVARQLFGAQLDRTVRFVAFANEEHPFFQTRLMGSWVYAMRCRARGEKVVGMLSLETLGFYTDAPRSQRYPFPFNLFCPSTGNFAAFLSNLASRPFMRRVVDLFRKQTDFPALGVSVPAVIKRIGWSDDWGFWQEGYPALSVTDTAWLRYVHYHMLEDTPEKLDYARMAVVTDAVGEVVRRLASE
jgi:Zn-dependent M28 family amino/carboxypeptidase